MDNVNTDADILYYVAECDEYPFMGEVIYSKCLNEAVSKYKEFQANEEKSLMGNSMGITYVDSNGGIGLLAIAQNGAICERWGEDWVDDIKAIMKKLPVLRAVDAIHKALPEYQFFPPENFEIKLKMAIQPDNVADDKIKKKVRS